MVAVRGDETASQVAAVIDAAEQRVRAAVPIAGTIYLEPDIYRPSWPTGQTRPSRRSRDRGAAGPPAVSVC